MPQLFRPYANTLARVSALVAVLTPIGAWVAADYVKWSPLVTRVGWANAQPVAFSHKHHVKAEGIDCRYCHATVEHAAAAGMPSSDTCMTCHSQIWTDSPLLAPVRESFETGRPLRWNRVHVLPDFVYFDHSIHLNKGVACVTCHGQVEEMPLTTKVRSFYMRDCLSCHRHPDTRLIDSRRIANCTTCHR
jgi:hypothetical protein